ncbi:MAG TPA: dTDP-4-dehydrorhamnose 3,5-epimerase [Saprospiraceae bacterium]|nr:dTDP-4-dehydrorhamnose 3,5-epimerase [Saprospiraceae bacterium]MCB9327688.1 dTDP-4-dehydrorhamnose 3,5-epimerase [Lewinellaceae bacterium]HPK09877.1 dTDP-4-dehydrorhamnose 3,5-epimerase [Saprospiraceae bacterium]HPQ22123.1 dTDP-4-dehydrorhamnose 3,5-epimerase [Saprospiraceae bacterium]HRX29202.1 dTDP-4-dehydrorhamnose 3,5-epimerase [Saprospiraceae bacterium]
MEIIETGLEGLLVLKPKIFPDKRGYFVETYNQSKLPDFITKRPFVQDNESKSTYGVLRGLHYQTGDAAQSKLVRVILGEVMDVVLDLREHSRTYGSIFTIILNDKEKEMLYVPRGFAHGYITLSPEAIFAYKCDNYYSPQHEGGIHVLDPNLGIDWRIDRDKIIISDKDMRLKNFNEQKL